jgi:hypothetical protein
MKSKIVVLALVVMVSMPALATARHGGTCPVYLCGSSAAVPAAPVAAADRVAAYPPGPTLWGLIMSMFGG